MVNWIFLQCNFSYEMLSFWPVLSSPYLPIFTLSLWRAFTYLNSLSICLYNKILEFGHSLVRCWLKSRPELGGHRFHAVSMSMSTPRFLKNSVSTSMSTPQFRKSPCPRPCPRHDSRKTLCPCPRHDFQRKIRVHVHATVLKKSRPLQGLKKSCPCPHQDFLWVRFKVDGPKGVKRNWTVHRNVDGLEPNWTVFWARVNRQGSK